MERVLGWEEELFSRPDALGVAMGSAQLEPEGLDATTQDTQSILAQVSAQMDDYETVDTTRMYLNEIGKASLLDAAGEVELGRRIEAGQVAEKVLAARYDPTGKVAKEVVDSVGTARKAPATRFNKMDEEAQALAKGRVTSAEEDARERFDKMVQNPAITDDELRRVIADGKLAKDQFIAANLRLVVSIAKRYRPGNSMTFMDFVGEGNAGLVRGVEKFDYKKGWKFSTYATWWIRQAITRAIDDQDDTIRVPVNFNQQIKALKRRQRDLVQEFGREPTREELAEDMILSEGRDFTDETFAEAMAKIDDILTIDHQQPVSYDQKVGDGGNTRFDDDTPLLDLIGKYTTSPDKADREALQLSPRWRRVQAGMRTLTDSERRAVLLRYGLTDEEPMGPKQIAARLGCHPDTVDRWLMSASEKLRRSAA